MAGFEQDPESYVAAIRRLLDQYSGGFAFVKELIQNANDGGATKGDGASELLIRWHPGLCGKVNHPLLRGPALLAINDGPFELKDRDGLMRMGLGSGGGDPERIGRFGLGMKAAFHVCEGFFFLDHSSVPHLREFCTPWHPKYYESWNIEDDSADWETMRGAVSKLVPKWKRWFCVWIPLRRQDHCEPKIAPIRAGEFPGEMDQSCPASLSDIFSEQAPRPGELLIFLNRLKAFSFNDGIRNLRFARDGDGRITPSTRYFQSNVPDDTTVAESWQSKDAWPKVFGIGERHERVNVPDKAQWTGGIAISQTEERTELPHLRIFWCVFLPVGDAPCVSIPLSAGDRDIHIFVHGFFFLNDSRTAVLGTDNAFEGANENSELGIRTAWNKALATSPKGVVGQLIPCLEKVQAAGGWSDEDFRCALEALRNSDWFKKYRSWITFDHIFGRMLHPGREWKWCSVPTNQSVFALPQNTEYRSDLESLVSSLIIRPFHSPIRIEDSPGLLDVDLATPWPGVDLAAWVGAIWPRKSAFTDSERRYLRSFLLAEQIDPGSTDEWKNLPIYEVEDGRTGELRAVDAKWIEEASRTASLFSTEDRDLANQLLVACPDIQLCFLRSGMPPGVSVSCLDGVMASKSVLGQKILSPAVQRLPLVSTLLESSRSLEVGLAIRYLLHGSWAHSNDCDALLLFRSEPWAEILFRLTDRLGTGWAWIDPVFQPLINPTQRESLRCSNADAHAFRDLCDSALEREEVDLAEANLHEHHDFLLLHLMQAGEGKQGEDHRRLARLPIHRIDDEHHISIEEDVWLEPGEEPVTTNHDLWASLRRAARIVKRARQPMVRAAQEILFSDRILDRDGVIRLAATRDVPSQYSELILECLAKRTPSTAAANALRQSAWLPLTTGQTCEMSRIVWLSSCESLIPDLLRRFGPGARLYAKEDLAIDFTDEAPDRNYRRGAWKTLTNAASPLLPAGERMVEQLRDPVKNTPALHFGLPSMNPESMDDCLHALEGISHDCLPALTLVRNLCLTGENPGWHRAVAELFFIQWNEKDLARYIRIFNELRLLHRPAGREQRTKLVRCFHLYLEQARLGGLWEALRQDPGLELLNVAEEWKPVGQLTHVSAGIDSSARLHLSSARALGFGEHPEPLDMGSIEVLQEAETNEEVMEFLNNYADALGESLSARQWGLFLALMGPNVRVLADAVNEDRTDSIRVDLVGSDRSPPLVRLVRCNYVLELVTGETIEVESLSGNVFNAPLEREITSFLVPKFGNAAAGARHFDHYESAPNGEWLRCAFRDPEQLRGLGPTEISACLEQTIRIHQREVLGVEPRQANAVADMMQKANRFEQLGVRMAQQEMLLAARMQFSQLAFRADPGSRLGEAVKLLGESDRFEAQAREEQELGFGDPDYSNREAASRKEKGLNLLRTCLSKDASLDTEMARAMSRRIEQEQYRREAVAFELFQNADDAYLEANTESGIFCVDFSEGDFRCAHWGRAINESASDDPVVAAGQKRDLIKMLVLHGSDKGVAHAESGPTGKFGLGFKSVFLLSDTPKILSREVAVQIRCGFFPVKLQRETRAELDGWLKQIRPDMSGGTAIGLTLRDPADMVANERFCKLASYLPLFARRIREIRITGEAAAPITARWKPEQVLQPESPAAWHADVGFIHVDHEERSIIVLRQGDVSWIFGYANGGLHPLDHLPCIWITAPTMEADDLGFALNAPFEPDPGRTRLSTSRAGETRNAAVMRQAADLLSRFLAWVAEAQPAIGGKKFEPKPFWTSVWRIFSKFRQDEESQSARNRLLSAIWARDSGYGMVILEHPVLPNELAGYEAGLTSVRSIRFQTADYLDSDHGRAFLREALSWHDLWNKSPQVRVGSNEIVISRTASILQNRLQDFESPPKLSLGGLVSRIGIAAGVIDASRATLLGSHLSKSRLFPEDLDQQAHPWKDPEKRELAEALELLGFMATGGDVKPAKLLLIRNAEGHERLRASLAPPERVLAAEYETSSDALSFFRLCRSEMQVTPAEIVEWIRDGVYQGRIQSGLEWLVSDDPFISEVAQMLGEIIEARLLASEQFAQLSNPDQNRVRLAFERGRLDFARTEGLAWNRPGDDDFTIDEGSTAEDFENIGIEDILDAWDEDAAVQEFTVAGPLGKLILRDGGGDAAIAALLRKPETIEGKAAWYRLLCLGCSFSTLLGIKPRERVIGLWGHRLGDEFWSKTIPDSLDAVGKVDFNRNLDAFFEKIIHRLFTNGNASGEDAEFWRRVFYDFRKMHYFVFKNRLPETILDYTSFAKADGPGLIHFLKTGLVQDDFRDPNQTRFTGVIGQSMSSPLLFIMRELARLKVIDDRFSSACYYVNRPARRIARGLGWIQDDGLSVPTFSDLLAYSQLIHKKMEESDPTMVGHYDLPLQWYALTNR